MMMSLGVFVFELVTLPYQEMQRRTDWKHARIERIGTRAANQFMGPGEDAISLTGVLVPGIGKYSKLETIREMATLGFSRLLINGQGVNLGEYVITALDTRETLFFVDGAPRKIDFAIDLSRID